jgi:hypothetical protein
MSPARTPATLLAQIDAPTPLSQRAIPRSTLPAATAQDTLHFQANLVALRVLALARFLWTLLRVFTCGAAMLLADGGLAVAARMFALLRGGHKRSS